MPKRLAPALDGHEVTTVQKAGYAGFQNGDLLSAIENGFDAFVTIDSNLEFQQRLVDRSILVVVIHSASNRFEDLLPLVPKIRRCLNGEHAAGIVHVESCRRD